MRTRTTTCILSFACVLACSPSSSPTNAPGDTTTGVTAKGDGGGATTVGALDVVFNEVASVGPSEWIELANRGSTAVDISNYFVADSAKQTNEPRLADAMKFPGGTTIEPGGRIVIVAAKKSGAVGPHPKAECLVDGPDTCFFATFGVSATNGESLHLLAPNGSVVMSAAMPRGTSADAGGSTTETQCRLPDFTGEFTTCAPTPGQPNEAP